MTAKNPGIYPIHVATSTGYSQWNGTSFVDRTTADGLPSNNVTSVSASVIDEFVYVGTDSGLSIWNGSSFVNKTTANGLIDDNIVVVLAATDGKVYIGTGSGLSIWNGSSFTNKTTANGLIGNNIFDIAESLDGKIWITSPGNGVSAWDGSSFTNYTTGDGLPSNDALGVFGDSTGKVWIGTEGGGVAIWDGSSFSTMVAGLVTPNVRGIGEGTDGKIYLSCWQGISIWDGSTFTNHSSASMGISVDIVQVATITTDGKLFFGSTDGFSIWDGSTFDAKKTGISAARISPTYYVPTPTEATNVKIVNGRVVGETNLDPTVAEITYGGLPLPDGSVLRRTTTQVKYLKISGGTKAFSVIPQTPDGSWGWLTGTEAWAVLQDM